MMFIKTRILITLLICLSLRPAFGNNQNYMGLISSEHKIDGVEKDYLDYAFSKIDNFVISSSTIKNSNFHKVFSSSFSLYESELIDSDFSHSNLINSEMNICQVINTSFRHSKLQNSVISCQFEKADFSYADIRGADLSNSYLGNARLFQTVFNLKTKLPFSRQEALRRGMIELP